VRRSNVQSLTSERARELVKRIGGGANQFCQHKENGCWRQVGRQGRGGRVGDRGLVSLRQLLFLTLRGHGQVDDGVPETSPGELLLPGQARQEVADRGAQQGGELLGRGSGSSVIDQRNECPG
jgi:hypothetical protein